MNKLQKISSVFFIIITIIVSSLTIPTEINAQDNVLDDNEWTATLYMDENGDIIEGLEEAVTKEGKEFWLETTSDMPTIVIENKENNITTSIIMKNNVTKREFHIPKVGGTEFYTSSYKNLYTEQEFMQAEIKPDIYLGLYDKGYYEIYDNKTIKLEPEYYYVGGVQNTNTFVFEGYEIYDECEIPFKFNPNKIYSDPSVGDWPPLGKRVVFNFRAPNSFKEAYQGIKIKVIYEMYDGISAMKKRVEIVNTSNHIITVGKLAPEVINVKDEMKDQIHMETTFTCGTESTVPINTKLPCGCKNENTNSGFAELKDMVHACYEIGPAYELKENEEFITYDVYELLYSTYWFENKCREIKGMYKKLFPWTTDNPITFHCTGELTKEKINHAAEAGFEMIIQSYSAPDYSSSMLTRNGSRLDRYKNLVDYAHSKGIDIGIYQAQYTLGQYRNKGDSYGSNGIGTWGTWCMASVAFDDYWDNFKHFVEYTGLDCVEIDGPYPGCPCDKGEHHINKDRETDPGDLSNTTTGNPSKYKMHYGYYDSVVKQWENAVRMLTKTMRDLDVYVKVPAWYYLNGGNKCGIGYEEVAWSQPRREQLIYGRQIIYNSSYGKNTSLSWSHIPFVQYHGGGESAAFKPFYKHLDDYNWVLAQNLGNGVTSDYRGDTLFDDASLPIIKKWVDFYKRYRGIINSDMVKITQAKYEEGSDRQSTTKIDTLYHVNSKNDGEKGLLWIYNQSDEKRTEIITVPMYYTGLTKMNYPNVPLKGSLGKNVKRYGQWPPNYSWIPSKEPNYCNQLPEDGEISGIADFIKEGVKVNSMSIDSNGNVKLEVTLPPMSFTYYTIYEQGQAPETIINVGKVNNFVQNSNTEHSISLSWDENVNVTVIENGKVSPNKPSIDRYNIYRDGEFIGSSITNSYTDKNLSEDKTFTYTVEAVVAEVKGLKSTPIIANTLKDTVKPKIINVISSDKNTIRVIFDEPIDTVTGSNIDNYTITEGINVIKSQVTGSIVTLTVNTLESIKIYTLNVENVTDKACAKNVVDIKDYRVMYGYISSYPLKEIQDEKTLELINQKYINIKNATVVNDVIGDVVEFDSSKKSFADLGSNLLQDNTNYSISMWIKTHDLSKQVLMSQGQDEIAENDFTIYIEDGFPKFGISNTDGSRRIDLISTDRIHMGQWNNIILSYNGEMYSMYLNGNLVASKSDKPLTANYQNTMYLGAITNSAGGDKVLYYNGLISNVNIFNLGLSKQQVKEIYYSVPISISKILDKSKSINSKYFTNGSFYGYQNAISQLETIIENDNYDISEAVNAINILIESRNNLVKLPRYVSAISIYDMDEKTGNDVIDGISGIRGKMINGDYMRLDTPFGKGIYINDCKNNLIKVESPINNLNNFTIMGWFKFQPRDNNNFTDEYTLAGKQVILSDNQLELYILEGKMYLEVKGNSNTLELESNEKIRYNKIDNETRQAWNNFAITKDNNSYTLYQNGINVAQGTLNNISHRESTVYIGSDSSQENIFNGILDEFVFYADTIPNSKINELANDISFDKEKAINLSVGKDIFSDSMTDGYRINDGKVLDLASPDTPWTARKSNKQKLMYGIDLGKEYNIDAISLTQFYRPYKKIGVGQAGFRYYKSVIQISTIRDFSSNVITVFNNDIDNILGQGNGKDQLFVATELGNDIVLEEPVIGRYVRLFNSGFYTPDNSNINSYINVAELEIFGQEL